MSARDSFPSIIAVTVDESREEEVGSPSKFNQMREQQLLADLNRADAGLKAMKMFRIHNERQYQEKELRELRKKEIREPLDEALTVIDVLQGKLARRDEMIYKLRKYITVDLLKTNQSNSEDSKAKVLEFNQIEEHSQMVLMDSVSEFQKAMEHQSGKIENQKKTINLQKEKIKSLTAALDTQEFTHKEHIRTIESDKISYLKQLEGKENIIGNLNTEKEAQKKKLGSLDGDFKETRIKLQETEVLVKSLQHTIREAEVEYQQLHQKYATTEFNLLDSQDALVELKERFADLRTR